MQLEFKNLEQIERYKLMSNLVIPRPIAWISTISSNNVLNLAPFSYFTPLSSNPATFIVSIGHKQDGSPKDTLKNLRETKKCSIVIATDAEAGDLNASALSLPENVSEFQECNIEQKIINPNYPAIPKSAKIAFFCSYLQEVDLKNSKTIPVIVELQEVYIDDSLVADKEKLRFNFKNPLARVGTGYYKLGEEIEV